MYILGVDCAWTAKEPSGVALIKFEQDTKAEIIKLGRSYEEFCSDSIHWYGTVKGSAPDFSSFLYSCNSNGWDVDIIALDIPLSSKMIIERRPCDGDVLKYYGGKGAAVHSPTAERPGKIALDIYEQLTNLGYKWNGNAKTDKAFIEVYPHASIIELLKLDYRLPYKVQKANKYWHDVSAQQRNYNIISNLNKLKESISENFENIDDIMPILNPETTYTTKFLKGYEDTLDALICAITGLFYAKDKIKAFGNTDEKIWVLYQI